MKRSLRQRNKASRRGKRLMVQSLEKRQLMAADIGLVDGFVAIQGTEMDDIAEVYCESESVIVKLSTRGADGELTSKSETFDKSEVEGIVFQAGDGDDLFVNDTDIDSITRSGGGNDTVFGGGGNDILAMGSGNDIALGGGGDDVILGGPGDNVVIPTAEEEPVAENPVDEEPVIDDVSDENASDENASDENASDENVSDENVVEADSSDQGDDAANETAGGDVAAEAETETENESTEDTMFADETVTIDDEAVMTDDGDVVVEDFVDDQPAGSTDEPADANGVAEDAPLGDVSGPEGELVTDTPPADEPIDLAPPVDLSEDEDDEGDVIETPSGLLEDAIDNDESDNDVIFGGSGDDWIFGGSGSDLIFGGASAIDDALLRMVIADQLALR